jgi:2-oxoglutarate ferredoxin oxidoreductase subunit beta
MKEAINHRGFSLVDIFQPCVTFNRVNTYDWYRKRCYRIEAEYNPEDRIQAFQRALEFGSVYRSAFCTSISALYLRRRYR